MQKATTSNGITNIDQKVLRMTFICAYEFLYGTVGLQT